jgi:XTP/dITP diphosphohydrolase
MPLLIATNNAAKLREFRALLAPIQLVGPADLSLKLEVEEDGRSFLENATLKAAAFSSAANQVALADDSGLEVDALQGAPGIHSARFGTPDLDDAGRCQLLLDHLRDLAADRRQARFRCCIVAVAPDGRSCRAEDTCEGIIAPASAGQEGFGYDPIFYLPEQQKTMAQIGPEMKNQISHRARALRAIRDPLLQTFPELQPTP